MSWKITEKYKANVEAVKMDATRRSLCVSRRDNIRNAIIKQQIADMVWPHTT